MLSGGGLEELKSKILLVYLCWTCVVYWRAKPDSRVEVVSSATPEKREKSKKKLYIQNINTVFMLKWMRTQKRECWLWHRVIKSGRVLPWGAARPCRENRNWRAGWKQAQELRREAIKLTSVNCLKIYKLNNYQHDFAKRALAQNLKSQRNKNEFCVVTEMRSINRAVAQCCCQLVAAMNWINGRRGFFFQAEPWDTFNSLK